MQYTQFNTTENQYQRKANPLESLLNTMQVPVQALAGATDAILSGENPISGAQRFVREKQDFISLLQNRGAAPPVATTLGFAANVITDPFTYLGGGELTAAGKVARAASLQSKMLKEAVPGLEKLIQAGSETADVAATYGKTWAQQAALKQRSLISFAGQPLIYGEKVFQRAEEVKALVGNSVVGSTMEKVFGRLKSLVPESVNLREQIRKGKIAKLSNELGIDISNSAKDFYDSLKAVGLDEPVARDILRDTVELSKPGVDVDLTNFMDPQTRKKYVGLVWRAEAGRLGMPEQMYRNVPEGTIESQFAGRRRRPNVGASSIETVGSEAMEGAEDVKTGFRAAAGHRRTGVVGFTRKDISGWEEGTLIKDTGEFTTQNISGSGLEKAWKIDGKIYMAKDFPGKTPQDIVDMLNATSAPKLGKEKVFGAVYHEGDHLIGEVTKKGKSGKKFVDTTGLGVPNLFATTGSWDFNGQMPQELIDVFEKRGEVNSVKAIRRFEAQAIENYSANHINQTVAQVIDKYGWTAKAGEIHTPLMKAVNFINTANAAYLASEQKTGLRISQLAGDLNYLKRMMTPEGRDAFIKTNGDKNLSMASSYEVATKMASRIQRDDLLRNLTVTEINKLAQEGKLTLLTGGAKVKLFEDEPFFATFRRGTDSIKAIQAKQMVDDFVKEFGHEVTGTIDNPIHPSLAAPLGHSFLPNRLAEDMGVRTYEAGRLVRDVALPNDIVKLLNSHYERVLSPAALQPALRGYDALQRMWKNLTLPIWPAYHVRNLLSDFLMITHGADDYGLSVPNAVRSITDVTKGLVGKADFIEIRGQRVEWTELKRIMEDLGLLDHSPGRELDDLILNPRGLKNNRKGLLGLEERMSQSRPIDFAIHAGQFRQNATNAGYFVGLLREGVSPEVAALEVKKRLFDFQDLTDWEKQTFRRVFPFYSWLRHNIPYQISAMLHKPGILTKIGWLRDAQTEGNGPAGDIPLPSFLQQGLPMALAGTGKPGAPNFIRLRSLIPQADIMALSTPIQELENDWTPIMKTPYEIGKNINLFQDQPLERYPGEMTKFAGVPLPARTVVPVLSNIRPFAELNNLLRPTSPMVKAGGLLLTKAYAVDTDLQKRLVEFKLQEEQVRVKKLMAQAQAQGDSGAIIRLRKYLLDVYKNPAQLLK